MNALFTGERAGGILQGRKSVRGQQAVLQWLQQQAGRRHCECLLFNGLNIKLLLVRPLLCQIGINSHLLQGK